MNVFTEDTPQKVKRLHGLGDPATVCAGGHANRNAANHILDSVTLVDEDGTPPQLASGEADIYVQVRVAEGIHVLEPGPHKGLQFVVPVRHTGEGVSPAPVRGGRDPWPLHC